MTFQVISPSRMQPCGSTIPQIAVASRDDGCAVMIQHSNGDWSQVAKHRNSDAALEHARTLQWRYAICGGSCA